MKTNCVLGAALLVACLSAGHRANAQLTILHHFRPQVGSQDGSHPSASLIQTADGNFYGPTYDRAGLTKGFEGTIYQITSAGVEKVIHIFTTAVSCAQPLLSYKGELLGVSLGRGASRGGKVFALTESHDGHWSVSNWYLFSSGTGNGPTAPLIEGSDGNLYGTTQFGGSKGLGTIYQLVPATKAVNFLYSFTQLGNCFPQYALLQASNGDYYGGTTDSFSGCTIFKMTPGGKVSTFYTFATTYFPAGPVIQASDGNFYVAANYPGTAEGDTMLQITPSGVATILHTFGQGTDGRGVSGAVVQGPNGNLYGMTGSGGTAGNGTIFEISTDGSSYTVLHNFGDGTVPDDGNNPVGALVLGTDNNLYGVTLYGGSAGDGTVFKISP
jgi:uncharacterized repeat protein (TIGR03803 family)